jgi:hypothetical protein
MNIKSSLEDAVLNRKKNRMMGNVQKQITTALLDYVTKSDEANIKHVKLAGEHPILYVKRSCLFKEGKKRSSIGKSWERTK